MANTAVQVLLLSLSCVLFSSCEGQGSSFIHLVGGRNQSEGRVEVYRSGEWQTVCDSSWDIKEAEVVCRQLGYGYAILAIQGAAFGQGSGGQWDRDWHCNGSEASLDVCVSDNRMNYSCSHSKDASVICSDNALSNGSLRLVGTGNTQFGGRLEFYYNNTWGTVCDDSWGSSDATVACRQMGFVGVNDSDSSLFGFGASYQSIWLDNVACSGSESQLIDCSYVDIGLHNCGHSEDVGIICAYYGISASPSDIRLAGGRNQYEGRVEVNRSGEWQTVCDSSWDIKEAEVVCHQLGYGYAILAIQGAAFGEGSGGQWDRVWHCKGNEASLDDCSSSSSSTVCSHSEVPSVICSGHVLSNGSLRLVGTGNTQFGGRLEVYYNNKWGTVCDDSWGTSDATVACRQMGFLGVSDSDSSRFGSGASSQRIWLDDVTCSGSESRLVHCSHAGIGVENCVHSEDVGIICTNAYDSPVHSTVNVGAIAGGVVGGVIGVCLCCAVCLCITLCYCYCYQKKGQRRTTATPRTTVQPATVAINKTPAQDGQQDCSYIIPPEYNPGYDPALQAGYEPYPATTFTQPSPCPAVPGGTVSPTKPPAEGNLPPAYPTVGDGTLPPAYPAPGGPIPAGYPPQQPYPLQPPDQPPPYSVAASPFDTPK